MLRLSPEVLDWLCDNIPDAVIGPKGGRPPAEKRQLA